MCQRSAAHVGVDLLDAGVPAVGLLGLDQAERAVGQHRVVVAAISSTCAPLSWPAPSAPALPLLGVLVVGLRRLTRRTSSRAVMCSFLRRLVNAVNGTLVISASLTTCPACSSHTACG